MDRLSVFNFLVMKEGCIRKFQNTAIKGGKDACLDRVQILTFIQMIIVNWFQARGSGIGVVVLDWLGEDGQLVAFSGEGLSVEDPVDEAAVPDQLQRTALALLAIEAEGLVVVLVDFAGVAGEPAVDKAWSTRVIAQLLSGNFLGLLQPVHEAFLAAVAGRPGHEENEGKFHFSRVAGLFSAWRSAPVSIALSDVTPFHGSSLPKQMAG